MPTAKAYFAAIAKEQKRNKQKRNKQERKDPPKMTGDVWEDIRKFQEHHGFDKFNPTMKFLASQLGFLKEELNETIDGAKKMSAEEVIDGLVDLIVVAVGTLRFFGDKGRDAWIKVMNANCRKEVGFNPQRPHSDGCDLIKPSGWKRPDLRHESQMLHDLMTESSDNNYEMIKALKDRGAVRVLEACIETMKRKSNDYASENSSVTAADYYPRGIDDFVYMIDVLKRNRQTSIIDKMRSGAAINFEALEDTMCDRLIYLALAIEWCMGETPGQVNGRDIFNQEVADAS